MKPESPYCGGSVNLIDKYYWASTQKNLFFFRMKQFRHIAMHSDGENYNKRNVIRKYKKENYKWTSR